MPAPSSSAESKPAVGGKIFAVSGDPVSGAHVRVISRGHAIAETMTDAAGHFGFDKLAVTGPIRVGADHDPEGAVRSAEIVVSSTPSDVSLVLAPAGIGGQVVDGEDGHSIANASLSVEAPFAVAGIAGDAAGAFHLVAVPFEATAVVVVADGYRATRVVLEPREDRPEPSLRIVLHAAPPIEGAVVDVDGHPIHAQVVACANRAAEIRVDSADDGTFKLPAATIGCDAFATHDGMAPSDSVSIASGRHLSLSLGAPGAIAGFVVDDRGRSVDEFSVGVESFIPLRGTTAAPRGGAAFSRGAFRLDHLTPGTYVLTASTPGRPPARSSAVVVKSSSVTDGVTIAVAPGGVVEGRVVDDRSAPVEGVELRFDLVSVVGASDAVATTNASGRYRLEGAPSGLFTVSAHKDGFKMKLLSGMTVASGATTTKDLTLTKGNGVELTGIGANLRVGGNGVTFGGVVPGNPAALAGLRAGDRIVSIDGEEIAGLSLADAIQRLRGDPGTVVGVTVERGGETLDVPITRAAIVQ